MGTLISLDCVKKEEKTALFILGDLKRRGIITANEKDRIEIEFKEAGVVFAELSSPEKNLLMEYVNKYTAMSEAERKFHSGHLQDVYVLQHQNDKLIFSGLRIKDYVKGKGRQIVVVVHALMAAHIAA